MKYGLVLAASTALVAVSGTANATVTIYTTQASFLAAVSAPGVDTFNNVPLAPVASPLNRSTGTGAVYSYTATTLDQIGVGTVSGFYGAGSGTDHWLSTDVSGNSIQFSGFSPAIRGLGGLFFGSDAAGLFVAQPDGLTLTATDASGTITTILANPTVNSFLGFVSDTGLLSATVRSNITTTSIWPTVNNLTLGVAPAAAVVPEPASWALMIGGFGLVGLSMRRRSTRIAVTA